MANSFFNLVVGLLFGGSKGSAETAGGTTADKDTAASKGTASASGGAKPGAVAQSNASAGLDSQTDDLSCCSDRVHIAYRGVSDDRLYLSENRSKGEVKFFRPIGLRVFCAECRKRLL